MSPSAYHEEGTVKPTASTKPYEVSISFKDIGAGEGVGTGVGVGAGAGEDVGLAAAEGVTSAVSVSSGEADGLAVNDAGFASEAPAHPDRQAATDRTKTKTIQIFFHAVSPLLC